MSKHGPKTGAALAVGLGAITAVGVMAYLLGSKKSDPSDPFRVTSPSGYRTWKFDTDRGHVKIQHPVVGKGNERDIESVLSWYPPGSYPLAGVKARLADIGAKFVPWAGGEPGDTGFWDEIDLDQMREMKTRRESARQGAGVGPLTFNDLKRGDRFRYVGGREAFTKTEFDKYIDKDGNGGDADDLHAPVVRM
jgi:hypothetical protein